MRLSVWNLCELHSVLTFRCWNIRFFCYYSGCTSSIYCMNKQPLSMASLGAYVNDVCSSMLLMVSVSQLSPCNGRRAIAIQARGGAGQDCVCVFV